MERRRANKRGKAKGAPREVAEKKGDKRTVAELIQALGDKRWRKRARAVEALGNSGDKSVLPHLIRALNDRKNGVRMVAAEALVNLEDKRAVPHLAEALDNNKGRVLLKVGWALGRLGAPSELARALEDRRWQVREAAVGLGEIGEKAVPHLRCALDDQMQEVRARSLGSGVARLPGQLQEEEGEIKPCSPGENKAGLPSWGAGRSQNYVGTVFGEGPGTWAQAGVQGCEVERREQEVVGRAHRDPRYGLARHPGILGGV